MTLPAGETILICGSRDANETMLQFARNCALRAIERGWSIIAGDALGVDQAVAEAVLPVRVDLDSDWFPPLYVYGLDDKPRHGIIGTSVYYHQCKTETVMYTPGTAKRKYLRVYEHQIDTYYKRDQLMVSRANHVMCIWNGRSKGTFKVYQFAQSFMDKESWLRRF